MRPTKFQFQSGSIKTSIMKSYRVWNSLFQFQSGSIKTATCGIMVLGGSWSFNSNLVRLKHCFCSSITCSNSCFNSNLVRLKLDQIEDTTFPQNMFQFQSGSIKTHRPFRKPHPQTSFNSNLVRLKLAKFETFWNAIGCFNSNLVRLKLVYSRKNRHRVPSFNSNLVRLKRENTRWIFVFIFFVSIPIWFD